MHSIAWFWTTGRFDALWVQAVASVALVVLTLVTFIVLVRYAWDTRTLARVSVEQIEMVKRQNTFDSLRRSQAAYDCVFKANDDLKKLLQSLVDGTFGSRPQAPIYPSYWPDASSALIQRNSNLTEPTIAFGLTMRQVDFAVEAFYNAANDGDRLQRKKAIHEAVTEAASNCRRLTDALQVTEKIVAMGCPPAT
jgi:type IV secretory pathway VirB6-like protein